MHTCLQQSKKDLLTEKKRNLETMIQKSKLQDRITDLNERVEAFGLEEKRVHHSLFERVRLEHLFRLELRESWGSNVIDR